MMRAAIYARYSSDLQSEASIDDQVHNCRLRIDAEGWELIDAYSDRAVSGASTLRPGYQRLLMDARAGLIDVIVVEALDRLSRDQEDIAALHKQLIFAGVTLITLAEGEINELHVGLKGTMNALFLKDLAQKTHRGLAGRVRDGKSGGGRAYGYDVIKALDEAGNPIRGDQRVNEQEAAIVRRIFQEYVHGKSPRAIAIALNRENVAGPSSKGWTPSTIIGNRKRGTGILNNHLYVGKRIWNRLCYRRDPETRKRVSQLNPPELWIFADAPQLRIIDDDLWNVARSLQESRSRETRPDTGRGPDWRQRQPKHLFSGLIKCAACGGGMSLLSRVYYGCAASRNKGTCTNRLTLRLDRLEEAGLRGLQERLVTPELTDAFVREYTAEINRLRQEASSGRFAAKQRLTSLSSQIDNIVDTVAYGKSSPALLERLEKLEAEKGRLELELGEPEPEPIRLHPNIAEFYIAKVADLRGALDRDGSREEATAILRGLVEEIRLHPVDGELHIELIGELATLLHFAGKDEAGNNKPGPHGDPGRTKWLVAGTRIGHKPKLAPMVAYF
jgi:site-specific DNA recombinase